MHPTDTCPGPGLSMDLHIHSWFSDSPFSIDEIFMMAKKQGLSYIGIADHDTTRGLEAVKQAAKNHAIKAISAIEVSAYSFSINQKVHVLAYGYEKNMPQTEKLCNILLERRTRRSLEQIELLIQHGYDLDPREVTLIAQNSRAIYKQHIMEALIQKGYTNNTLSPLYSQLFKGSGICSGDMSYLEVEEVIKAVKLDGCMAVIAHPAKSSCLGIIKDLVKLGLDGLEINHPDHDEADKSMIQELANCNHLILSGGSDFHGSYGSSPFMGCCETPHPEKFLEKLTSIAGKSAIVL